MAEYTKEPKQDCIHCQASKNSCRALSKLYCAMETAPCRFFKSKHKYNMDGSPKKEG